jgi:hypothetical protein
MNKRASLSLLFVFSLAVSLLVACSGQDNPADPGEQEVNQSVAVASKASVDIYQNVAAFNQTASLMQGASAIVAMDVPDFTNPDEATVLARKTQAQSFARLRLDRPVLNKSSADSTIWDITERDSIEGVTNRVKFVYDPETGIGSLFVVRFEFRDNHPLVYDSTAITVDLNQTLLNDGDDVLLSIYNLKRYREGHLIREEIGTFVPEPYAPGSEPQSGVLTNTVTYGGSSFITSTDTRLEYDAGAGGSYAKTTTFSDGSQHLESATFTLQGTGSFEETKRDGTHITGTFDSMEEDGSGSYSKTTTFPAGHDPVTVAESGTFSKGSGDGTFNGSVSKEVTYQDGRVETETATVEQTIVGDVITTSINADNEDGHGFIAIVETPDVDQISGEWTNADETFIVFTAQAYADGSAHLEFKLYESEVAFENGAGPIASGEFDFYPDGSGHGVVQDEKENKAYDVTIDPDGKESVVEKG